MTEQSFLMWSSNGTGDGDLAGYTQTDMQLFARMLMCGYNTANLGGVADFLNKLAVTGTVTPVSVNTGGALVYGIPYTNDAAVTVAIPTPGASTRVDRIVLRADWTAQTVRITRIAGTEGAGAPAMTQTPSTTWDIPLATASITTGGVITVTDGREWLTMAGDSDITTAKLVDDAVTGAKIADYTIDPRVHIGGQNGIVVDPANGNARGTDAVDLQTIRAAVGQVASGTASVVGGGENNSAINAYATVAGGVGNTATAGGAIGGGTSNTASGADSAIPGGNANTASASMSSAIGFQAVANKLGQHAHAAGMFAAVGDAQRSSLVLRNSTANATPTELFLNGATLRMTIATDTTWVFSALIVARRTDADNESAGYEIKGVIDNNAGTTALVGSIAKTVLAEDTAAWDVTATADNTNDALVITVTGEAAKTIRWVAYVTLVEVTG